MDSTPLASRRAALDVLAACLDKGQPLDDALSRHQGFAGLDPRDRAFVRLLLATTLRRLGEIEEVLAGLVERPLEGANAAGRQILRLGAAQLLFLGTPPHAAVDTSVRLAEDARLPHLKGLTNAVLRRISRDGPALMGDRDPARLNTPQWLWESWVEAYGEEETHAIAAAHLIEAPLDLTPRSNADFWAGQLEAEKLPTGTLRRHPDIAWLKDEEDVGRLTLTQDRLLARATELLKPGGMLVYAVCSLQEDEGPARFEALLSRDKRLRRQPVEPAELPGLEAAITKEGDVRTLPSMWSDRGGLDGFFIGRAVLA